jgi:hypothetical protein
MMQVWAISSVISEIWGIFFTEIWDSSIDDPQMQADLDSRSGVWAN